MPSRKLPRTDDGRTTAMNLCSAKYTATVNTADRLITSTQFTTLGARLPAWTGARDGLAPLLRAQTTATGAVNTASTALERFVSHFIQVFNFGVLRGVFTASDRTFYQLDASSDTVPSLDSDADVRLWAARIGTGETARVAAGGTPMAMPSATQVAAALTAYINAVNGQTSAKTIYDEGQEAVNTQRPAIDALIADLWDTIEYNLRANDPASLRRKAREWGVVYDEDEEDTPPTPPAA